MATSRLLLRSSFRALRSSPLRPFSTTAARFNSPDNVNDRSQDTTAQHRQKQTERPLNPRLTNTTSTIANEVPSVGEESAPPDLLSAADPHAVPKDSVPENTERMTGGTQQAGAAAGAELGVGELEGASFRVEPLRRTGEDLSTMRARLLYQSRKRGTLESELLMSTFADAHLGRMTRDELEQYDRFLDENDWDIYYWATQEPVTPTSAEYAEGAGPDAGATPTAQGKAYPAQDEWKRAPARGEWAQTVGTFKPAYRPVPSRWKDSAILAMLRQHVRDRSAGGKEQASGMGFMPDLKKF